MKSDNAARVSASVAVVPVSRNRRQADANDGSAVGRSVSTATHRRGFRRGLGRLACDMSGRASWGWTAAHGPAFFHDGWRAQARRPRPGFDSPHRGWVTHAARWAAERRACEIDGRIKDFASTSPGVCVRSPNATRAGANADWLGRYRPVRGDAQPKGKASWGRRRSITPRKIAVNHVRLVESAVPAIDKGGHVRGMTP